MRKRAWQFSVWPKLVRGCEVFTVNKQVMKTLEATEIWFWRKTQKIPWRTRKTNEEVLTKVSEEQKLVKMIRKRWSEVSLVTELSSAAQNVKKKKQCERNKLESAEKIIRVA